MRKAVVLVQVLSLWWVVSEKRTALYLILIIAGWVAIFADMYLLFSMHLLWIFNHASDAEKVLYAVYRPARALFFTLVLFLFFVYWFACAAYSKMVVYPPNSCTSLASCVTTTFDQGFKNDGGIGGYLDTGTNQMLVTEIDGDSKWWYYRFAFDHLFNILLMVLLLNIVFGLVIDTFSEMRAEAERRDIDMLTTCTICDLPAGDFDQAGLGFKVRTSLTVTLDRATFSDTTRRSAFDPVWVWVRVRTS